MQRITTLGQAFGLALGFAVGLAGAASAQVKFGMAGPITGPSAATGAQMRNGVEQAAIDINAAGGILGQKITVEYGDDVSDPKQGVSVANKFAADGVKFVIGDYNSGVTIPSSEVYQENGILEITPASTNPTVTERKMWNIFRTCGRDDQQGAVAGAYIVKHFKGKKIAVIDDKTTYGKGLADETVKGMAKGGMKPVLREGINTGEKDYSALVSKIKQSGADLVYFGGLYTEGGLIVRQMRDQGVKAPLMGGDGITSDEFASVGGPGVEGTLMTYGPDPRNNPAAKEAVAKFRAKKFEPEAYTLYSYAGVQIVKQAAEAAKSLDPKKVAEKMHSGMKFKTVLGDISYDKKGDLTKLDYVVYIWKKDASGKVTYAECPNSDCSKMK
jgi:branched-chain amino acid transport system substrate-binding protein